MLTINVQILFGHLEEEPNCFSMRGNNLPFSPSMGGGGGGKYGTDSLLFTKSYK